MLYEQEAADIRPPAHLRARIDHAEQIVAEGLAHHGREQFILAALEYQSILADPDFAGSGANCADVQARLGAVLCLIAQTEPSAKGLDYLTRAQTLLRKALGNCQKTRTPLAWARMRANLAIVLMTRYGRTRVAADLFTALMTLEGVADAFTQGKDFEAADWALNISGQLNDMRKLPH